MTKDLSLLSVVVELQLCLVQTAAVMIVNLRFDSLPDTTQREVMQDYWRSIVLLLGGGGCDRKLWNLEACSVACRQLGFFDGCTVSSYVYNNTLRR